jgi:hypothetical protein
MIGAFKNSENHKVDLSSAWVLYDFWIHPSLLKLQICRSKNQGFPLMHRAPVGSGRMLAAPVDSGILRTAQVDCGTTQRP